MANGQQQDSEHRAVTASYRRDTTKDAIEELETGEERNISEECT